MGCQDQFWTKKKKKRKNVFSCLQWNVIQVNKTHNKSPLLEAYNTIHNFDILFISETYLDSFVSVGDTSLSHPSYNLVWFDDPNNVKRSGACLYYKENLSWIKINLTKMN